MRDGAQSILAAFAAGSKYGMDSKEQHVKEQALGLWLGKTGLPASKIEDEDFIIMMQAFDKKLTIPKRTKHNNLVEKMHNEDKIKYKERLATAQKVTLGLDIWSKKRLTASFLVMSACTRKHILLRLAQINHPHTAETI